MADNQITERLDRIYETLELNNRLLATYLQRNEEPTEEDEPEEKAEEDEPEEEKNEGFELS